LESYEIDQGTLPDLKFFPDDPLGDRRSLAVELARYGVERELCVCPAAPASIRRTGLAYLWNFRLNGKQLQSPGGRRWVLVEIHALSDQVPPPHLGRYHVLYTDGTIERSREPPPELRGN
jgi:hypothetical protein